MTVKSQDRSAPVGFSGWCEVTAGDWLECARREMGELNVTASALALHVASLAPWEIPPEEMLSQLNMPGLYLACACLAGEGKAIQVFESRFLQKQVDSAYARLELKALSIDDARQLVRSHLFVGVHSARPGLAKYRGLGDLSGWTRVVATRVLLRAVDRKSVANERPVDGAFFEAMCTSSGDSELDLLKNLYGDLLSGCLRRAIAELESDERTILRWQLKGFSCSQLGRIRGVHPRTMQRRIAEIHERIATAVGEELRALSVGTLDGLSLIRLVISQLSLCAVSRTDSHDSTSSDHPAAARVRPIKPRPD